MRLITLIVILINLVFKEEEEKPKISIMNFTTDDFLNEFQKEATKNNPVPPPQENDFEFFVIIINIGSS
jgi:hypothetical protein